jgi:hypothetical protein
MCVIQGVKSQLQAIVLGAQNNENLIWTVARDCGFMHNVHPDMVEPDNKHVRSYTSLRARV